MNTPRSSPKTITRAVGLMLGLIIGLVGALSLRGYRESQARGNETAAALMARAEELTGRNARLREEIAYLEGRVQAVEAQSVLADQDASRTLLALQEARMLSGQRDMRGPGVEVVLNDAPRESIPPGSNINWYLVHDVDVLRVVNLLRGAGAECISINGERLVSNSRIRCGGPTIHVKDRPLAPPFVIHAIGDSRRLNDALTAPREDGGMSEMELLSFYGLRSSVQMVQDIAVPRYIGEFNFRYAQALEE